MANTRTFDVTVHYTESFDMVIEAVDELDAWSKAHATFKHGPDPDRSDTEVYVRGVRGQAA